MQAVFQVSFSSPTPGGCVEPLDLDLRFTDNMHESFLMLTSSQHRRSRDIRFYEDIRRMHISGNRTCSTHDSPDQVTSQCPWHYVLNVDQNRRPVELIEAKCNCQGPCVNGPANSKCHPVKYYIRVLRKYGCDLETRTFLFRQTVEPLTVGCTCGIV